MIETIKVNINGQVHNYSKDITINDKLPIALKIINGSVPNYYNNPIT